MNKDTSLEIEVSPYEERMLHAFTKPPTGYSSVENHCYEYSARGCHVMQVLIPEICPLVKCIKTIGNPII